MTELLFLVSGLVAASGISYLLEKKDDVKEGFGNIPAQAYRNMPEVQIQNRYGANMMTVPPSWQGNLSPRFSNTGYGAFIRYNIPEEANLGVPQHPLDNCGSCQGSQKNAYRDYPQTFSGDIREGYAQSARPSGMAAALQQFQSEQHDRNDSQFVSDAAEGKFQVGGDMMKDMNMMSDAGQQNCQNEMMINSGTQIYNYDRLVYAQKRSRLHGLGDPIRGDLPIVPIQGQWFTPSVVPNLDLRQGAVTTISGMDNASNRELRALQAGVSGKTALAQKDISFDSRQSDIFISAFP